MNDSKASSPLEFLKRGHGFQFGDPPNYPAAEASFRKAIEIAPQWGEAYHALGVVLQQQDHWSEACVMERKAITLSPCDPRPRIALGRNLQLLGMYAEAAATIKSGLELKPHYGQADATLMLAEIYESMGQVNDAASLWREVLSMEASYPSHETPKNMALEKLLKHKFSLKSE